MSKLIQLKAKREELSRKALAIATDETIPAPERLKQLAPIERDLNTVTTNLADEEDLNARRKGFGNPDEAAGTGRIGTKTIDSTTTNVKAAFAEAWAEGVVKALEEASGAIGTKALVGNTIDIPSIITAPIEITGRPTTILELIPKPAATPSPSDDQNAGNTYSYLRQTVRNLRARGVPDGAQKPQSDISFEDVEGRYHVYATLSEVLPKRYLDDYRQLVAILRKSLGEGLIESLEQDALLGTGIKVPEVVNATGTVTTEGEDPFLGLLNIQGLAKQAFTTDKLTTLTAARFALENSRIKPNAWVLNPTDLQQLTLMRENGDTGALLFGTGRTQLEQFLGDYPIIPSPVMPAGRATLGDWNETQLRVREGDHLDIDGSGPLFKRNQVQFRQEGRYGFEVLKPSAFIDVDLTA